MALQIEYKKLPPKSRFLDNSRVSFRENFSRDLKLTLSSFLNYDFSKICPKFSETEPENVISVYFGVIFKCISERGVTYKLNQIRPWKSLG